MKTLLTSVEGNRQWLDGGAMFGNAPRTVWQKWIPPDELGRIPLACRSMLIELDGKKILLEAGIGAFFEPKLAARYGVQNPDRHMLRENLQSLGHSPESINFVILSHLHFDHAGGLLPTYSEQEAGQNGLIFPNATYIVGSHAWERAKNPHPRDRASFIPGLTEKLEATGRLIIYPESPLPASLASHFEFITSDGHTPGQLHTLVKGDKAKAFFCGDLVPGEAWVHIPITMGYDRNAEAVIDEKTALYPRAFEEHWLMFFTHDPKVSAARLELAADGKYHTTQVQETLLQFAL